MVAGVSVLVSAPLRSTCSASLAPSGALNVPATAGVVVRVYRNGAPAGTATVSGTNWSFSSASLADGTHTFLARIETRSGYIRDDFVVTFSSATDHSRAVMKLSSVAGLQGVDLLEFTRTADAVAAP